MYKFLDNIIITTKDEYPYRIDTPFFNEISYSLKKDTLVSRGEQNNSCLAELPQSDNDVANKKYFLNETEGVSDRIQQLNDFINQCLLKNSVDSQSVEGPIEYAGPVATSDNLVTKGYVDSLNAMRVSLIGVPANYQFPSQSSASPIGIFIDWGDESGDISFINNRHTYTDSGNYNVIFYFTNSIPEYAFNGCDLLTNIIIPNSVNSIGIRAFSGCVALSSVIFEKNSPLSSILSGTFRVCSSLESIVIPKSVKLIDETAFLECDNLNTVYYEGSDSSEWGNITIVETGNTALINAARYFYSETEPTTTGDYWHYVNGVPTIW